MLPEVQNCLLPHTPSPKPTVLAKPCYMCDRILTPGGNTMNLAKRLVGQSGDRVKGKGSRNAVNVKTLNPAKEGAPFLRRR